MENIIKKAIEGGWKPREFIKNHVLNVGNRTFLLDDSPLLDPLFWQALGKSLGWENGTFDIPVTGRNWIYYVNNNHAFNLKVRKEAWNYYGCRFHEINLTEGWEKAVEWLNNLIGVPSQSSE